MNNKGFQYFTVLLFALGLFTPLMASTLGLQFKSTIDENRGLTEQPAWSWTLHEMTDYPEKYEAYYADNFGLRNTLIHSYSYFQFHGLDVSPSEEKVTVGEEDWLFYSPSLRYTIPQETESQKAYLEIVRWYFETIQAQMAQLNIPYVVVVCPDKKDIYREFTPSFLRPNDETPWASEFIIDYLKEHSSVPIIDLSSYLNTQKEKGPLFQKTDTHWN